MPRAEQPERDRLAGVDGAESGGGRSCADRDQSRLQGQPVSTGAAGAPRPGEFERRGGHTSEFPWSEGLGIQSIYSPSPHPPGAKSAS